MSLKKGDYAEVIARSEKELAKDPPLPIFHHYIVKALRGQGRTDEAIRRLRKLLEIAPYDNEAQQELAQLLTANKGASR
jgi:tetratricopeptide (TPR) repeat protein